MQSIKELINQKKVIILGSGTQCDWVINDSLIDEKHCQISSIGDNQYLIADLGTRNGTFVNNEKITHKEINENDFVAVGSKIFQLKSALDNAKPAGENAGSETSKTHSSANAQPNSFRQEEPKADIESDVHTGKALSEEINNADTTYKAAAEPGQDSAKIKSLKIYCLYASEDEQAAIFLDKHLAALKHNQNIPIEVIGNFNRKAGDDRGTDNEQLKNANIILVFISADLISNESSYNKTMIAIDNHNKGKSLLLPILTRRCMWKDTPFSQLPLLPKNLEPLYSKKSWESEDDSFSNVVSEIKNSIDIFYKKEQEYRQANSGIKTGHVPLSVNTQLKTDFRAGYYWGIFWKRVFAYLLDSFIIYLPITIVMALIYQNNFMFDLLQTIVNFGIAVLVLAFFESGTNMATPGKRILGLVITDENNTKLTFQKAVMRNAIKYGLLLLTFSEDQYDEEAQSRTVLLTFVYIIGQVVFYAAKHKFFQDALSKTVISPKTKTN